ncbi:MAG: hypothetical protein A3D21_09130 [Nitrospirae bacterium RIFCSPHIGHO2_02_FULL_42_12]|nr:MAG: hypothetical protein A3D21_09130 [Nitrospirae bacterium RIFCSPHIGHO2_02_FULL_42_12]
MKVYGNTNIGRVRKNNEDAYGIYPDLSLFIVADGLGGHAGGEVASRLAVETIKDGLVSTESYRSSAEITERIIEAIKGANNRIIQRASMMYDLKGMGTTVVVVKLEEDNAMIAHVGDSRMYLIRKNKITQITKDHTVVEEYIRLGLLTLQEALYHPNRHMLSRALGVSYDIDVDVADIQIAEGDIIILCTDGLTNMLSEKEILSAITELMPSPEKITDRLITLANNHGGIDNITVITICIEQNNKGG